MTPVELLFFISIRQKDSFIFQNRYLALAQLNASVLYDKFQKCLVFMSQSKIVSSLEIENRTLSTKYVSSSEGSHNVIMFGGDKHAVIDMYGYQGGGSASERRSKIL